MDVKAKEAFEFTTTMSCLEADGRLHTFIVVYDESPGVLIVDMRRSLVTGRGDESDRAGDDRHGSVESG